MRLRPSNRRQRKRASHFSCLCKKSNPKNTPPRDRPSGKPWPDLLQPGRPKFERRTRQGLGHGCPKGARTGRATSCRAGTKWAIPGPFTRLPQASPRRSQGGPSLRPRLSNNSAPDEGFPAPLEAPWTGLRRPGERAMEGPFSPATTGCCVGTARSERPRPWLARRAPPWGCPFFGTFLWASKERYSPACDAGRSKCAA